MAADGDIRTVYFLVTAIDLSADCSDDAHNDCCCHADRDLTVARLFQLLLSSALHLHIIACQLFFSLFFFFTFFDRIVLFCHNIAAVSCLTPSWIIDY